VWRWQGYWNIIKGAPVAGPYKVTILWNFQGSGFSESWYYNITSSLGPTDLATIDAMATTRNMLTASSVNMVAYRVSDVSNPRQTIVKDFATVVGSSSTPDVVTNSWLAMARGPAGQGRRQFWMRGIADAWIQWDTTRAQWKLVPTFKRNFDAFVAVITKTPWSMRVVGGARPGGGGVAVQSVAPNNTNGSAVLTLAGAPPAAPATIIVGGFRKPLSKLNGTYIYPTGYAAGSTSVTLRTRTVTSLEANTYITGAQVRAQTFSYVTPSTVQLISPRERRVGRAFFVPRGRRSVSR
jgi:hypothetical protein